MKISKKKIMCVILVVCMCLTVLPRSFSFMAADSEPELSAKCETVIDKAGKDGTFGTSASDLRTSTSIKYSPAINLSNADVFELNVYVENISAIKSAITDTQYIQFGFSSNSRRATANHAEVDISSQLTQNGWNSVCVNKSDFIENNINWSSIYYIFIRFSDEQVSIPDSLTNNLVKIRNICESYAVPDIKDIDNNLYSSYVIDKLGENDNSLLSYIGETFKAEINTADLSDATMLKVDLLISDLSRFKNFISGKKLRFVLDSTDGSAYCDFIGDYIADTLAGWYTVQLSLGDFVKGSKFDTSDIIGFKIEIIGNDENETIGDAYDLCFGFTNLLSIVTSSLDEKVFYGIQKENYSVSNQAITFPETYTDFSYTLSNNYRPLADAQNIEFYLYIDNYEELKNSFFYDSDNQPINASLNLKLSEGVNTLIWLGIEKKVIATGWNHIILPIADAVNQGFDVTKAFSDISLEITGVDATHKNPIFGQFVIIDNLISTKGEDTSGELKFEEYSLISQGKSVVIGSSYSSSEISEKINSVLNLNSAEFIEFDVFIQNFDVFKTLSADKGVSDIGLKLSSSAGNSVSTNFLNKITNNGWNHIVLSLNSFINGEVSGTFDITKVNKWELIYSGDANASTNELKGQKFDVKNVIATVCAEPKMPDNIEMILSEEGKFGTYGESYSKIEASSVISFSKPLDLSQIGQIEFDFYVDNIDDFNSMLNASINPLYVAIGTDVNVNSKIGLFNFTNQIKDIGWNHIVIYTANYKYANESNSLDLNTVYHIFLTFDSETGNNSYKNEPFKFKNIVGKSGDYKKIPLMPQDTVGIVTEDEFTIEYGEGIKLTFSAKGGNEATKELNKVVDLSAADYIEFDIFVTDLEIFKSYKDMYLSLYPTENPNNGYRADLDFVSQVTTNGWNHVKFKKSLSRSRGATGSYPYNIDWTNVSKVALMTVNSGAPEVTGTGFAVIANICGTIGEGYYHSLDFGPYPIDFEKGANINGKNYKNGDLLNTSGVYKLKYTESDVQYDKKLVLYKLGDANCDNEVNILDLVRLKEKLIGTSTLNTAGEKASDLTLDGKIASDDLVLMRKNLLFDSEFPITSFDEEDMSELVDFTVEVESGREMRVLQLSDTQIIESEQQRTSNRLASSLYKRWVIAKKDENYHNCLTDVIESYKPDLIIITGDLIYGEFDDSGASLVEFIRFMDSFKIPWAPVFGNHENESHKGVDWQCDRLENSDYCLFKQRELTGNGNYTVGLKQDGVYKRVFFMLDSNGCGSMSAESKANGHSKTTTGFGEDQIEWYTTLSQKMRYAQPEVKFSAAFHIQLKVFEKAFAKYGYPTLPFDIDNMEDSAETDFGFMGAKLKGGWDGEENVWYSFKNLGFDSIYVGHEHANSASVVYKGVRLQYGQKSSTYDRANYINSAGELVINSYEDRGTPIIGGTAIPVKTDGSIGIGELLLYEEK